MLLVFVVSSGAFAASARWNALGGDHRFIIDTSNYSIYPGRVTLFGDALFIVPVPNFLDNNVAAGALLNVADNMTLAYHYNLASAGAKNLSGALAGLGVDETALSKAERELRKHDVGTPEWDKASAALALITQNNRLAALTIRTFPDLFWGIKTGNVSLGIRLAAAMDSVSDVASTFETHNMQGLAVLETKTAISDEITTSAKALDLSLGATMYKTPAGDLDLGLRVGMQSFADESPSYDTKVESTGGMDLAFDARLNKPLGKEGNKTLVPLLSVNIGSLPSADYNEDFAPDVTAVSYTRGNIGIGLRNKVKEKGLLVLGVVGGYSATTFAPITTIAEGDALKKKELPETTDVVPSATVLAGCEFPINKWLAVRGGVNVKFASVTDEIVVQEVVENFVADEEDFEAVVGSRKSTNVGYYYNMGFRTVFGGLIVDVLLARNIVHRGPYFLTGATGTWATNVCVVYKF